MKAKVYVGKKHIDTAEYGDPQSCMLANAIKEQLETGDDIHPNIGIDEGHNYLEGNNGLQIEIKLPQWVKRRIKRWDNYESSGTWNDEKADFDRAQARTKPFEFEFELPDDWREQLTGKRKYR